MLVCLLTLAATPPVWASSSKPTKRLQHGTDPLAQEQDPPIQPEDASQRAQTEDVQDYRAQADEPSGPARRGISSFRGCTAYVASQLAVTWIGHARSWAANARAQGYPVDTTPTVGAIMVRPWGNAGHVAIVRGVEWATNAQGERTLISITIQEGHYQKYTLGHNGYWVSTGVVAGWGAYYSGPPNATLNQAHWRTLTGGELAGLQYIHGVGK